MVQVFYSRDNTAMVGNWWSVGFRIKDSFFYTKRDVIIIASTHILVQLFKVILMKMYFDNYVLLARTNQAQKNISHICILHMFKDKIQLESLTSKEKE